MNGNGKKDPNWYARLSDWINKNGGYIHESLRLGEQSPDARGIFTNTEIKKGTLLIRLPFSLAISGHGLPSEFEVKDILSETTTRNASDWLRCTTEIFAAIKDSNLLEYTLSLPLSYETILSEICWPNSKVKNYLGGTTLGKMILQDRTSSTLKTRFEKRVKPYLIVNNLVGDGESNSKTDDELFKVFEMACACVSTRGFHLRDNVDEKSSRDKKGPFLLPFIDLLNHTSNPKDKCTTLRRQTVNSDPVGEKDFFLMSAERDISGGEEILHSYGSTLSSGQLLQTFGFVETSLINRAIRLSFLSENQNAVTPAVLSLNSIVNACAKFASSHEREELENIISQNPNLEDFDVWDLPSASDLEARNSGEIRRSITNDILINYYEPISEDLITLCCAQFLPIDAYTEICSGGENDESMTLSTLSVDILEDFFLGSLVLKAIMLSIDDRLAEYSTVLIPYRTTVNDGIAPTSEIELDRASLEFLVKELEHDSRVCSASREDLVHATYGLTLRIEEKSCLLKLKYECNTRLKAILDMQEIECDENPSKRNKLND